MGRGKRKSAAHVSARTTSHDNIRAHLRALGLRAYEVGGCVRDELAGRADAAKDVDVAVCGLTYDELATALEKHGFVEPNIVGGGKLGLRLWRDGKSELVKPKKGEIYRHFYRRLFKLGRVEPEVYDGEGRLVGCRLHAPWAPAEGIEISLARTERSTVPGRANFVVETNPEIAIEEDLARRDFTVNAIARDLQTGELIDPFNGTSDLKNGILRVIGPESFSEDPSRIIRGLVRVAKDGLTPDVGTLEQMRTHAAALSSEPTEQIWLDLEKLLSGRDAARALRIARDTGVLTQPSVFPELADIVGFEQNSRYHDLPADEHSFTVLDTACRGEQSLAVRLAALLHDSAKAEVSWLEESDDTHLRYYNAWSSKKDATVECPRCRRLVMLHRDGSRELVSGEKPCDHCGNAGFARDHAELGAARAREALKRFKQPPAALINKVELLSREHMYRDDEKGTPLAARRFIRRVGRDNVEELLALRRADRGAKDKNGLSPEDGTKLRSWEETVRKEMTASLYVKELAITGHDVMRFGFEGPAVGATLNDILAGVIAEPEANEHIRLLTWVARRAIKAGLITDEQSEALLEEG